MDFASRVKTLGWELTNADAQRRQQRSFDTRNLQTVVDQTKQALTFSSLLLLSLLRCSPKSTRARNSDREKPNIHLSWRGSRALVRVRRIQPISDRGRDSRRGNAILAA